jgi:hypothetical protein
MTAVRSHGSEQPVNCSRAHPAHFADSLQCRRHVAQDQRYWTSGLTLPYLKALTPPGHEVAMLDELFSDVDLNCDCDLVGITAMGPQILLRYEAFKAGWLYRMYFHWPRSS